MHYTNAKTKPELQRRVFVTKISLSRRIGLHARCRLLVLITSHAAPSQSPMLSVQCVVVSTARVDAGLGVPVPEYPALVSPVIAGLYILIVCGRRRYSFRRRPAFKTLFVLLQTVLRRGGILVVYTSRGQTRLGLFVRRRKRRVVTS